MTIYSVDTTAFSVVFGWKKKKDYYLKYFWLANLPPLQVLWLGRVDFLTFPHSLTHWHFRFVSLFQLYTWQAKKNNSQNQITHLLVISQIINLVTDLSLTTFESSYICFVYNVQSFYLYLTGGIGKSLSAFIFYWKKY